MGLRGIVVDDVYEIRRVVFLKMIKLFFVIYSPFFKLFVVFWLLFVAFPLLKEAQ